MRIFQLEKEHALAEMLLANNSVAISAEVSPLRGDPNYDAIATFFEGNVETPDTEDLFYTKSVFVSTVWNLNADVFLPGPTWRSRKTPVDKPTNNSHNEMKIVGHITSVWAVDSEGKLIPDDTPEEDLPSTFHLCNSAVIYRHWRDRDLRTASDNLVADIVAGERFVSMECFFDSFDYALKNEEGTFQVVPRNEETAFLTKHLRAYGGSGEFDGYALGRVLRDFTFSGKGYVDRPANPASKIFDFKNKNGFSFASTDKFGVYVICSPNSTEKNKMSDENKVEKAIAEITSKLEAAVAEATKATQRAVDLEDQLKVASAALEAVKASESQLTGKFEILQTERNDLAAKLAEINAEKSLASRTQALLEKGFAPELAKAKVEENKDLSDEQFTRVLAFITKQPEAKPAPVSEVIVTTEVSSAGANIPSGETKPEPKMFDALSAYLDVELVKPTKEKK